VAVNYAKEMMEMSLNNWLNPSGPVLEWMKRNAELERQFIPTYYFVGDFSKAELDLLKHYTERNEMNFTLPNGTKMDLTKEQHAAMLKALSEMKFEPKTIPPKAYLIMRVYSETWVSALYRDCTLGFHSSGFGMLPNLHRPTPWWLDFFSNPTFEIVTDRPTSLPNWNGIVANERKEA
jgi:hypothetical protein